MSEAAAVNPKGAEPSAEYPKSRWFVMIAMMIAWVGQGAQLIQFAPVVGLVADEFGLSAGQMSFYGMGLYTLVMGLGALVAGFLIDRFGFRHLMLGAMIVLVAMALLVPIMTQTLSGTVAMRVICGFATGPILAAVTPIGVRYFPARNRATYMGVVGAGFPLGLTLSLLIMGMRLGQTAGDWRTAMMTIAILPAVALVMIIAMFAVMNKTKVVVQAPATSEEGLTAQAAFKEVLRAPLLYIVIIAFTLASWCKNGYTDLSPGYIAIDAPMGLGYGAEFASFVSMLLTIGMLVGSLVAGILIDKVFKSRPKPWLMIAFAVLAICILLTKLSFVTGNIPLFVVVLFILGFMMESLSPGLTSTIMTRFPPGSSGKIFGLGFGLSLFAASGGVMVGSMMLHANSSYQPTLLLLGIVAVAGFVLAFFFDKAKAVRGGSPRDGA
ncbi:MAG: MFS transporter [Clostridiales Family XIII bacterium]|jgi:MFS family permease|nr:MFS transporter [Clostridiales Family XIII bacterium]